MTLEQTAKLTDKELVEIMAEIAARKTWQPHEARALYSALIAYRAWIAEKRRREL